MRSFASDPALMFLALLALYSPLAALSSYLPVVGRFSQRDQLRLALGLFTNVVIFVLAAIWIGEPLLRLLGISTAALSVTGGIALLYAGVPMMRGIEEVVPEQASATPDTPGASESWRSVLFTPLTFPLTVGGTSFGLIVAFASRGNSIADELRFTVAGLAYALVTGVTLYAAGHLHRRVSAQMRLILSRVAGILLTAIAVTLLANGGAQLVVTSLRELGVL
ncbi:LysE family transporter [Kaistia defluvii]|uniref:MarC family protein n=1 Tax=Kaistia defluvii TaxID=410841 RepID=UPI002250AEB6|nr:MarC family protein [Kaistia defluvii]MCX5518049.1 LysE family transporter [Kaistia defluvii]